jgi:hypothetical protein
LHDQGVLTLLSTLISLRGSKPGITSNVGTSTGNTIDHIPDIHRALIPTTSVVITSTQPAKVAKPFSAIWIFHY